MVQTGTVRTDTFEMEYFTFGRGEKAFVIIPGVSMKSILLSAEGIEAGFAAFADHFRVYVFDRKKNMTRGYSVADMARDIADAMQALGIRNACVFGASQGGMIAQQIAIFRPELVGKLYLASAMCRTNEVAQSTLREWIMLAESGDIRTLNHGMFTKIYSPEYYETYRSIFEVMEPEGTREEVERLRIQVEACLEFDVYDELKKIKCPVWVVGSRCDRVLGAEGSEEIAQRLGCPLYLYDGFSHAVYDEAPDFRDRMLQAMR